MKCTDCEYFNNLYPPYRMGGILWDTGRAECTKYKLVVDTVSRKQIDKLVCIETQALAILRERTT